MKARNVRKGAIVQDDLHAWQAVVDTLNMTSPLAVTVLTYANGAEESMPLDEWVNTAKLTVSQERALASVGDHDVTRTSFEDDWLWELDGERVRRPPYDRIRELGLIEAAATWSVGPSTNLEEYVLTVSGLTVLGRTPAET